MDITSSNSLIIAPQWIGDAVMTEPLLRRLHARGERITVGALPWVAPVYRAMPQVADVIEFPFAHGGLQFKARRAIAKRIEGQFDTAYICPNSLKSALLPFLASIPKRVGYLGEARVGLLTHRLKNPKNKPPMVAFYSALSGEPGIESDRPHLRLDAGEVDAALQALGLQRGGYYVFAPGAEFGPAKRWPAAHFAELARLLGACRTWDVESENRPQRGQFLPDLQAHSPAMGQKAGKKWTAAADLQPTLPKSDRLLALPVVLLGSAKEAALCEEISTAAPGRCVNLAGKTSLLQAFGLIAAARSVVSNDSGLMHVAAAFGVPQVAVFGSSSPLHTPPLSDKARVLWLKNDPTYQPPLDCSPCFQRECPLGHTRCLKDLTAASVLENL